MSNALSMAVVELRRQDAMEMVSSRLRGGEDPIAILDECRLGMTLVGERFQTGDYFLSELILSAEIFKNAAALLDPHLSRSHQSEPRGTVVLATMKGDVHDLGKNIFATLLRAQAFAVHDLGVDVVPETLVARVEEVKPEFVGFSALITTAFPSMKEAADLLSRSGLRDNLALLVGGGVTTPSVKEYVGADFQSVDATEGVAYCLRAAGERAHGR
jgi:methanogenic corrinoid protein MtbC1